jgi:preprotein translocase subunit SecD
MAQKQARPARTLLVFFLSTLAVYGLVALAGTWKPALGLDLQGGTRITLEAKDNPSTASLNEAASIIDSRVNGSGVSEAEVTVQENDNRIIVEIPGQARADLEETVKRQAQLRFRMVGVGGGGEDRRRALGCPHDGAESLHLTRRRRSGALEVSERFSQRFR